MHIRDRPELLGGLPSLGVVSSPKPLKDVSHNQAGAIAPLIVLEWIVARGGY